MQSRLLVRMRWRRILLYAVIGLALALAAGAFRAYRNWPFTREAITSTLEARFARQVVIGPFGKPGFRPASWPKTFAFCTANAKTSHP